jgi:pilus assembly protein CpaE
MRAVLICPNQDLRTKFEACLSEFPSVHLLRTFEEYPDKAELCRAVRSWAPEIVFLNIESETIADMIANQLEEEFPKVRRVALHSTQDAAIFRRVLNLRMSQLLTAPFEKTDVNDALAQISKDLEIRPATINTTDRVFAFLPAKAGVGASTIAANATWAFGQTENQRVLLAEFDTCSGVMNFVFNVEHDHSLRDALSRSNKLDGDTWRGVVKSVGNIDLLLSGAPCVAEGFARLQVSQLIEFARRNYDTIAMDLPDTLDEATLTALRDSNRIFLVTTPELPALRLARLKVLLLQKLELLDKTSLVINRFGAFSEVKLEDIEKVVGLKVLTTFPSDYADVTKAVREGRPAPKLAPSVRQFANLAMNANIHVEKKARFIERFGIVPMRYGFR